MARAHQKYWRFNLALIAVLMTVGFVVSFVLPLIASRLAEVRLGGFRLPFYFGAQGAILIYLALIVVYIVFMQWADRRLQRAFDADADANPKAPADDVARTNADDVAAIASATASATASPISTTPTARGH